jgi:hypothetical protein
MALFNFFKNSETNKNIIYVIDRLLQISIDGEVINQSRKIDLALYQILNNPKVNQEIIHTELLPIIRENGKVSDEFARFVNNLWIYMEYDINTDFVWSKTMDNPYAQKNIYEKIVAIRKDIYQYLLGKKVISGDDYSTCINYKIKNLNK